MTSLPPIESVYYDAEIETMPRARLEELQLERLLELLPLAYERAPLIRETWDAAGVHPRDIRTLENFRERVPFIVKDMVRRFRNDRHNSCRGDFFEVDWIFVMRDVDDAAGHCLTAEAKQWAPPWDSAKDQEK